MHLTPTLLTAVSLEDFQRLATQLEIEQRLRRAAEARVAALESDVVDVPAAGALTGLGRTALYAEARRADTLLVRVPNGRAVGFTRASCVAYRAAKELRTHRAAA